MNEFRYIVAGNTDALLVELSNLHTGETAYITANEFERITGADLNEFSTAGRRLIGIMAAQSWCTIRVADGRISSEGLCQTSRIIKNERQIVYAWHRRLAIRPTKLCCSKWRKHGSA